MVLFLNGIPFDIRFTADKFISFIFTHLKTEHVLWIYFVSNAEYSENNCSKHSILSSMLNADNIFFFSHLIQKERMKPTMVSAQGS